MDLWSWPRGYSTCRTTAPAPRAYDVPKLSLDNGCLQRLGLAPGPVLTNLKVGRGEALAWLGHITFCTRTLVRRATEPMSEEVSGINAGVYQPGEKLIHVRPSSSNLDRL
jgi:hypothetical protein